MIGLFQTAEALRATEAGPMFDLLGETVVGLTTVAVVIILTRSHREERQLYQSQIETIAKESAEQMASVSSSLTDVAIELRSLRDDIARAPARRDY